MSFSFKGYLKNGLAIAVLAAASSAAHAQDDPDAVADPRRSEDVIVVTGSRIAGASDAGAIAVSIISNEQLEALGQVSVGELLENLPQAGSFEINDSADGPNDARGDVATVNLRGLGSGSTLILLNGRRMAAHGVFQDVATQGAGSVPRSVTNVNSFPAGAVDRIEVLRDGASALYGSDAVAGVVNTILTTDFDDQRMTVRYSGLEGTGENEFTIDLASGFAFNDDQTHLLVTGSYFTRDGLFATELGPQFNNVDKRAFLGDSPYAASTDFRNTSTRSPFGQFRVGELLPSGQFDPIDVGSLTASDGDFHVQPCDFSGTRVDLGTFDPLVGCVGLDDGNLNTTLRFDFNTFQPLDSFGAGQEISLDPMSARGRQLISDAERVNLFGMLEHDFNNGVQLFSEVLFYNSSTESQRAAQPIDEGLAFVIVPARNYYNPVGAITSPNRVAGISAPDAGLDVRIDRYRPIEMGPRIFGVDSTTYRVVGGLRGDFQSWNWETGAYHSANSTEDTSLNRISKTALQGLLNLDTPDAINVFGGPGSITPGQLEQIRISVTNEGQTTLTGADFNASRTDLFTLPAGDVGAAFGFDWRNESYEEDRDARLDGEVRFSLGTGDVSDRSDVVGVSPTADSDASRNVFAAFGEVLVPLYRSNHPVFVNEFNLQLAARVAHFDDINETTLRPKVALSYFPVEWINFRAAFSQGFRAPNLVQLNRGDISRLSQGIEDTARCAVTNDAFDCGDTFRAVIRQSNPDLKPEETDTFVAGVTIHDPFENSIFDDLYFYADYWSLEQTDIIGTLDPELILLVDALSLNSGGSGSPLVERFALTAEDQVLFTAYNAANPGAQLVPTGQARVIVDAYENLDRQDAKGVDFGVGGGFEAGRLGDFEFRLEATRLLTFDLVRGDAISAAVAPGEDIPDAVLDASVLESLSGNLAEDRIRVNGNPEWRATGSLLWRLGDFGAGASVRYVSGFEDRSVDNIDANGDGDIDFYPVEDFMRVNTYVDYRFRPEFAKQIRVRFGVNNVFDELAPLADESRGFYTSVHSVRGREFYIQLRATR